jgi:hypothetical protein
MSLNPRKTLHVVRAGNEKFLIAGDVDRTSLISKLHTNSDETEISNLICTEENLEQKSFKETLSTLPKQSYMDRTNVGITSSLLKKNNSSNSVMRNLADIMKK